MADQTFNDMLIHTCTIRRRSYDTGNVDKWGASKETISENSSEVPCLLQQRDEEIEFTIRGEKVVSKYMAFFKTSTDIKVDDIVDFDNRKYQVVSVDDAAGQSHHYEVSLMSLEN